MYCILYCHTLLNLAAKFLSKPCSHACHLTCGVDSADLLQRWFLNSGWEKIRLLAVSIGDMKSWYDRLCTDSCDVQGEAR